MTKSNQKRSELTEDQKKRKRESGKRSQQILRDRRKGINKKVEDNGGDPSILNKEELSEYNKLLSSKKRNKERRNAQKQARMASPEEDEKFKKKTPNMQGNTIGRKKGRIEQTQKHRALHHYLMHYRPIQQLLQ